MGTCYCQLWTANHRVQSCWNEQAEEKCNLQLDKVLEVFSFLKNLNLCSHGMLICRDIYGVLGIFVFGSLVTQLLTDTSKYTIGELDTPWSNLKAFFSSGRLRPHFLAVCRPNITLTNTQVHLSLKEICPLSSFSWINPGVWCAEWPSLCHRLWLPGRGGSWGGRERG